MEIDLEFFAQRIAVLALASGVAGAIVWQLIWVALSLLAQRLHERSLRRSRIAQARERAHG